MTVRLQVSPTEIKNIIASYADTSDVKKIQSEGFRVAGEKYMTIRADEKSVYGKKVHYISIPMLRIRLGIQTADRINIAGKGRCGSSQDPAGYPCYPLPRARAARAGNEYCGAIR